MKVQDLFEEMRATCNVPAPELAVTLPPASYSSPELYELEAAKLFEGGWLPLCRVEQIEEPGSYYSIDVMGQPVVVTRDKSGEIHVLSRTCRHRWMEVVQGCGTAHALQCPYHLWTYSLDGRLVGAPEMQGVVGFEKEDYCLPQFRHEIWQGFVLVNLDGQAPSLAPQLAILDGYLENYDVSSYKTVETTEWGICEWDWKIMVDNFMECYHHIGPHRQSLQDEYPGEASWTDVGSNGFSLMHAPQAPGFEALAPFLAPVSPKLEVSQHRDLLIFTVWPTLMIVVGPAFMYWMKAHPVGPGKIHLQLDIAMSPLALADPDYEENRKSLIELIIMVHREDLDVCRGVQRAVDGNGVVHVGRLSRLEQPLWEFYRYIGKSLGLYEGEQEVSDGSSVEAAMSSK